MFGAGSMFGAATESSPRLSSSPEESRAYTLSRTPTVFQAREALSVRGQAVTPCPFAALAFPGNPVTCEMEIESAVPEGLKSKDE